MIAGLNWVNKWPVNLIQFVDTGQLSLKCAQEHGFVFGYQFGDPQLQMDTMVMGRQASK